MPQNNLNVRRFGLSQNNLSVRRFGAHIKYVQLACQW